MSATTNMSDAVGVIDIGSNSVRLIVARATEKRAEIVYKNMITSRLLAGAANGVLKKESVKRTVEAIKALISEAVSRGAKDILCFGTCAMREGQNSIAIVDEIKRSTGVDIEILPGREEAKIAYMGVSASGINGILDIGGGSTELTVGEDSSITACASAPIGAVRLFETNPGQGPDELVSLAAKALLPAWKSLEREDVKSWTGVGGTVTSLAAMSLKLPVYDSKLVSGYKLSRAQAVEWLHKLCSMTLDMRWAIPGLRKNRADIIPFGTAILVSFFEISGADSITVTENDNMLGYLKLKLDLG